MITVLTGAPGHGKSYTSVKMIAESIHEGKPVVTNVPLAPDFALQMSRHYTFLWRLRRKAVEERAARYEELVHVTDDMQEIMTVRFEGKGEGRGNVVIDEAHRKMNVRGSSRGKSPEALERKMIVSYASGHRHYGANMILITQALTNMDTQVRNLLEFHSEVRNLRKLPMLGWLIRLVMPGGQLFIRVTWWNDRAKTKAGVHFYGLSKRLANLYDTHGLALTDEVENPIMLPSRPEDRPGFQACSDPADLVVLEEQEIPPIPIPIGAASNGHSAESRLDYSSTQPD